MIGKGKNFLQTTAEASRKWEGNQHSNAQNIDDTRIIAKVKMVPYTLLKLSTITEWGGQL